MFNLTYISFPHCLSQQERISTRQLARTLQLLAYRVGTRTDRQTETETERENLTNSTHVDVADVCTM